LAGKKREPCFNVLTAFREKTEAVNDWLERRNTADTPDAKQAAPLPVIGGESESIIRGIEAEVKELLGNGKTHFQSAAFSMDDPQAKRKCPLRERAKI